MRRPRSAGPAIDSPSNPTVRLLRDLHDSAGRRQHHAFLIEGTRLVKEAVRAGWPLLAALYDEKRALEDPEIGELTEQIDVSLPATARAIKHAAETVTPQGVVAAARLPRPTGQDYSADSLVLLLDGLSDPGNAGTLLRSALGAGVRTVLALSGSVDLFSPKVVRAGMGAHFRLSLAAGLAWEDLAALLGRERAVVLADMRADEPYYRYDWRKPSVLVIGSEARGPGDHAMELATARVSIPLDPALESLNAAVAGSVIMFEAKRQRDLARSY